LAGRVLRWYRDELALLQVRVNGDRGVLDVAEVRLTTFIERRGNADDDGVDILQFREIGGGAKMLAVDELLDFGLRDVLDVGLARVEHGHFLGIGVKSSDFVARFGEAQAQGEADVSASHDANFELGTFEKLGFSIDCHELRRAPRIFFGGTTGRTAGNARTIQYSRVENERKEAEQRVSMSAVDGKP